MNFVTIKSCILMTKRPPVSSGCFASSAGKMDPVIYSFDPAEAGYGVGVDVAGKIYGGLVGIEVGTTAVGVGPTGSYVMCSAS